MTVSSRVDQVGSLLRSQALREAWARAQSGQLSADELRGAQDEAIRAVIYKQEALGLPVATDGEFRRTNFQDGFAQSVAGFEKNPSVVEPPPGFRPGAFGRTSGRLSLVRNPALEEWRFSQPLTQRTVKITVVSPAQIALRVQHDLVPPFVTFEDRRNVYVDDRKLELIVVGPAHTTNDIVVWVPERKLLFAGDLIANGCTPFMVGGSVGAKHSPPASHPCRPHTKWTSDASANGWRPIV